MICSHGRSSCQIRHLCDAQAKTTGPLLKSIEHVGGQPDMAGMLVVLTVVLIARWMLVGSEVQVIMRSPMLGSTPPRR